MTLSNRLIVPFVLIGAGCVLVLALIGFMLAALLVPLTDSRPQHIENSGHNTLVTFDSGSTTRLLEGSCIDVRWQAEDVKSVNLNDVETSHSGTKSVCGADASFRVRFLDGETRTYLIERFIAFSQPAWQLNVVNLGLALLAWALIWQGLHLLGRTASSPLQAVRGWPDAFFRPSDAGSAPRELMRLTVIVLLLIGLIHWVGFFGNGTTDPVANDWGHSRNYWEVMVRGVETGQIPYFLNDDAGDAARNTNQFLGVPNLPYTPFLLLASLVSASQVALLTTLTCYAIGARGIFLIARRYRLSPFSYSLLFLLINFNGFITAHLGIGHVMFVAYFMLPWFVLLLLRLADDDGNDIRTGLKIGLIMFITVLLGGFHFFLWCAITLLIFAVFNRRWRAFLAAVISAGLLSAVILLPATLTFSGWRADFMTGIPTIWDLVQGMVAIRSFIDGDVIDPIIRSQVLATNWWEVDMYVGLGGFIFVAVFGLGMRFYRDNRLSQLRFTRLDMPILVMVMLALGNLYSIIYNLPIPLVNSERVPSRMLIVPLVLLIVISCVRLDAILPQLTLGFKRKLLLIWLLWQIGADLGRHSAVWSVVTSDPYYDRTYRPLPPNVIVDLSDKTLDLREKLYVLSLPVGLALTLITAVVCIWTYRRLSDRPLHSDNDGSA